MNNKDKPILPPVAGEAVAGTIDARGQEARATFETWLMRVNKGYRAEHFMRRDDGAYIDSHLNGRLYDFAAGFASNKQGEMRDRLASREQSPEAATVEQCIVALVQALQHSKGWMHDYADSIVRDAIDRKHLMDEAPAAGAIDARGQETGWSDDQMIRFGNYIRSNSADSHEQRLELFRKHEALRGIPAPASPDAGAGAVAAWLHESDSSRCISNAQKTQALRDGGASASSVKHYSIALSAASVEAPEQQGEALTDEAIEAHLTGMLAQREFPSQEPGKVSYWLTPSEIRELFALAQAAPATGKVGAAAAVEVERDRLRAEQAANVMPQIGPLLDAWDGIDNDTKSSIRDAAPQFARQIRAINRSMEEGPALTAVQADTKGAPSVLDFRCTYCDSQPDVPCVGTMSGTHVQRREALRASLKAAQPDQGGAHGIGS